MRKDDDISKVPMPMDVWEEVNEDELKIDAAESGSDRELDFDWDAFIENHYEKYLKEFEHCTESAQSEGVIIITTNDYPDGLSVQATPELTNKLAEIIKTIARQIEEGL